MNNEPVAIRYDFDGYGYQYMDSGSGSDWQTRVEGELLYTHPAKELTDEEIEEIVKDCIEDDYNMISNPYLVARAVQEAILRKAQEK